MEKSFDDITVSSLSDLQLVGNSVSGAGVVTIPDHLREASSQLNSNSNNRNGGNSGGGQQQQQQLQRNSSINGNAENNLNRTKKSSNKSANQQQQQQQQQQPVFNLHSKHLDVWLANAIRGLENASSQDSPDQLDSPTPKGGYGEPLSLPPNLNYLDGPNSSSPFSTGLFSPTQLPPPIGSAGGSLELGGNGGLGIGGVIQQNPYRFGGGGGISSHQYLLNDSSEFASLPPRITHQQQQQLQQQLASVGGRRPPLQRNQSSSFQDLLNAQRIMTDSYINDSSDNESKNSCAKSKLEMAETLLADLNLLNNGSGTSTASGNGIGVGGVGGGVVGSGVYNGTSTTSAASGVNQNNSANNNGNSNNLVVVLLKEISKLHETNKKICRNLHETKVEMEALKHSSHWGLSHRRDSISGLSTNSQPVGMRYNSFGLQSPAPTYHSQGSYSPGLVADVIREIREVSRVREEAMMDRMKTMIEERSWALNETNFRLLKETEEAKKSIHLVRSEMNQMVDRMLKLENEVINLRAQLNNQQLQQQQQQHQQQMHLRERDSYGQASAASSSAKHRRNSMHLNYGRINNTDEFYGGNNFNDLSNDLRYGNGNGSGGGGNLRGSKIGENTFVGGQTLNGAGGGSSYGEEMHEDSASDQVLLLEKDALKLRRELQDALASKQESENRITAFRQPARPHPATPFHR
ncbi:putative uncharacterized protein DDB_G0293878 isoform X3 [Aedes aegypti]|uniref:Uncharacterized protein n=1 Tax=Aedes aegypti TaxID=7159 RepID=A0A903U3I1_AEDAE|nr:putative uncharacterized protein DDB_G0293878 isoform X3 [Aedes aegypti]